MKRVVLVRPAGPRNVGVALRACANFGASELVLVAPERPSMLVHPGFVQMSHGVPGGAERVRVVDTLPAALEGCEVTVGFSGRSHEHRRRHDWRDWREELRAESSARNAVVALVFGNEERGLEARDVKLLRDLCWIPTAGEHQSINLGMAVGIVLCDLFTEPGVRIRERGAKPLGAAAREYLKANLKLALGDKVARSASARVDILASIDRIFSRAELEDRDARAWHLMCRALGSELTPKDLGLTTHERRGRRRSAQSR